MRKECETFVIKFLPTIKKILVKKLIREYGLTQIEVADKLNLSQPAISLYLKDNSEKYIKIEKLIKKQLRSIIEKIMENKDFSGELCPACYKLLKTKCNV